MENKVCGCCTKTKSLDCFYKDCTTKDGFNSQCKECRKKYKKKLNKAQKAAKAESDKKYHEKNKDIILPKQRQYYHDNKDEINKKIKDKKDALKTRKCKICTLEKDKSEFRMLGKRITFTCSGCFIEIEKQKEMLRDELKKRVSKTCNNCQTKKPIEEFYKSPHSPDGRRSYCDECVIEKYREQHSEYSKRIYVEYGDEIRARAKEYRDKEENKPKIRKYKNEYKKRKTSEDLNYKMKDRLRARVNKALRGKDKSASTMELIGCTIEFLIKYLESQFIDGMSWSNYGKNGWEVDHIRACCSFDLSIPEQQRECFHYTNLRPLWGEDNRAKISQDLEMKKLMLADVI